jgi:hypothetical protein
VLQVAITFSFFGSVRKEREIFINLDQNEEGQSSSFSISLKMLSAMTNYGDAGDKTTWISEAGAKHGRAEKGLCSWKLLKTFCWPRFWLLNRSSFPRVLRPVTVAEIYRLVTEVI